MVNQSGSHPQLTVIVANINAEACDRLIKSVHGAGLRFNAQNARCLSAHSLGDLIQILDSLADVQLSGATPDLIILGHTLPQSLKLEMLDTIRLVPDGGMIAVLELLPAEQYGELTLDRPLVKKQTGMLGWDANRDQGREAGELSDVRGRPDEILVVPHHPAELNVKLINLVRLRDLRVRQRQLDRRQRQLFEMLIHDMGNVVASVMAALSFYKEMPPDSVDAVQAVDDAFISSHLLNAILNDTLDVLRVDSLQRPIVIHRKPIDMITLIRSSIQGFVLQAQEKQVTLHFVDAGYAAQTLYVDPVALQRVLFNLLTNALKFAPYNTRIIVAAGADSAGSYHLSVEDEGSGFSPEMLASLFDPARQVQQHQAQRERAGRGLGLLYCRLVMTAHGGTLIAANRTEGGAILSAIFPIATE